MLQDSRVLEGGGHGEQGRCSDHADPRKLGRESVGVVSNSDDPTGGKNRGRVYTWRKVSSFGMEHASDQIDPALLGVVCEVVDDVSSSRGKGRDGDVLVGFFIEVERDDCALGYWRGKCVPTSAVVAEVTWSEIM